jgi:hypothetical protein
MRRMQCSRGYPGPPSPQFGQPAPYGYQPAYQVQRSTNGLAIASMVLGILWIYWGGSILALIYGYVARRQIRERQQAGDGMAITGIVLGWVGVGILAIIIVVAVISTAVNSSG